ncbi:MAG: NAD(P)H-hydrate dehydratase [Chlorobiota bacterium]
MNSLLTPKEMYNLDSYLIKEIGIPESSLMESAANSCVNFIKKLYPSSKKVLVVCGTGNNGGDGLAIAKYLNVSYKVDFTIYGDKSSFNKLTENNYRINKSLDIKELELGNINFDEYDIIIDAILGIGSSGILNEELKILVNSINNSNSTRISIDIPTGLNPLNGLVKDKSIKSDFTITMYGYKTGLLLNSGKDFSGEIHIADLGVPKEIIDNHSSYRLFSGRKLLNKTNNSSKFDYGKILIIAGSYEMPGAGSLASNSAISTGAGLVYLISSGRDNNLYSEVIPISDDIYSDYINGKEDLIPYIKNINTVIIGPGLGKNNNTESLVSIILSKYNESSIIIDADALNYINIDNTYSNNIVLTPHIVEFSRIIRKDVKEILKDLPKSVKEAAKKMNVNILLKGPTTIISDGEDVIFVSNGIPNMATAGSGDVLTGILGAYLHFNLFNTKIENIANSVYIHNEAAILASTKNNTLIASDIYKAVQCLK